MRKREFLERKVAGLDRKDMTGPDSTEKNRGYPDSDYTNEDYNKDFELDYLGFERVSEKPGLSPGEKEKKEMLNQNDHPAG